MNEKERAVMRQALEALEAVDNDAHGTSFPATVSSAITDLCAALAEPVQEPVGYLPAYELNRLQSGHDGRLRSAKFGASALDGDVAVYTAPPPAPVAQQPEPVQEPVAQAMQDAAVYGVGISRDGKRIDPASIYEQPAQEPKQPEPAQEPVQDERTTIADLRCAKWLDPECADKGACQSLKFKRPAEPAQEPVAWAFKHSDGTYHDPSVTEHSAGMVPLGPIRAHRPPLTDAEIAEVYREWDVGPWANIAEFARAIERKVRGE